MYKSPLMRPTNMRRPSGGGYFELTARAKSGCPDGRSPLTSRRTTRHRPTSEREPSGSAAEAMGVAMVAPAVAGSEGEDTAVQAIAVRALAATIQREAKGAAHFFFRHKIRNVSVACSARLGRFGGARATRSLDYHHVGGGSFGESRSSALASSADEPAALFCSPPFSRFARGQPDRVLGARRRRCVARAGRLACVWQC